MKINKPKLLKNPYLLSIIISLFLILLLLPKVLLLQSTPMGQTSWELQDPVVSEWNFIPGMSVLRHEFSHNKNILWSNLRSLGITRFLQKMLMMMIGSLNS